MAVVGLKKRINELADKYPLFGRYVADGNFKAVVGLFASLALNILFGIYNGVLGAVYKALINGILAAYYISLAHVKIGVIFGYRSSSRSKESEAHYGAVCHLVTGILLLAVHTAIAFLVKFISDGAFHYDGLLIYVYALYAFCKMIAAIVNLARTRKTKNLLFLAIRNINLADALLSIFSLQVAMLHAFGNIPGANLATGCAMCGIIMLMSVIMILRASTQLERQRREKIAASRGETRDDEDVNCCQTQTCEATIASPNIACDPGTDISDDPPLGESENVATYQKAAR